MDNAVSRVNALIIIPNGSMPKSKVVCSLHPHVPPLPSEYHLLPDPLAQTVHLAQGRRRPGGAAVLHQVAPHRARPSGLQREDRRGLRALLAGRDAGQLLHCLPGVDPALCREDGDGTALYYGLKPQYIYFFLME